MFNGQSITSKYFNNQEILKTIYNNVVLWQKAQDSGIVTDGLVLWLDGNDFVNSPPTTTWVDKSMCNSYEYTNLVKNSDYSNGITSWESVFSINTVYDNTIVNTSDGRYDFPFLRQTTNLVVNNNIIYYKIKIRVTNSDCDSFRLDFKGSTSGNMYSIFTQNTPIENQWYEISGIRDISTLVGNLKIQVTHFYADAVTGDGKSLEVQEAMLVDLTQTFGGAGKEPSQEWCDENLAFTTTTATAKRGNDATPNNFAYNLISGSDGSGGVVFDGIDDYLSFPITLTENITVEFSIEYDSSKALIFLDGITVRLNNNGRLYFPDMNVYSTYTQKDNAHYSLTYDGSTANVYQDGMIIATKSYSSTFNKSVTLPNNYFDTSFKLRFLRFYNRPLTQEEVSQNYDASK